MAAAAPSSVVGLPVVARTGRSIASVTFFKLGAEFRNHDAESKANAHLIAAAPELYEALTNLVAALTIALRAAGHNDHDIADCTAQANAAIAKATGEQIGRQ